MNKEKLHKLKKQLSELEQHRREAYDLSDNPDERSKQVSQMIDRMDDGVQANRLEKLIMHDQAIHEIDHLP